MNDKLDVTIGISADASGVEAGVGKAKKSLRSLGGSAKKVAQDVGSMGDGSDKAAKKVVRDTKSMERSLQSLLAKLEGGSRESRGYWEKIAEFKGVDKNALSPLLNQLDAYQAKQKQAVEATKSFSDSINGLQKAFVSAGAAAAAAKFISVADSVTVLNNQLKLATGSTESAALAYESLFQIAQRSRVGFTELGETFASITRAAAPLGLSQERLLRVTESIGNAMTISGGSAQGLQAALVQLSQGLSAGALRGDELNSVMEQAPRLAKALADGLGVTTGQLRAMGAEGQITAEKVIGALESQAGVLRGEVAGAALTVGQAFVQLGNSATHAIGSLDKATGASASAASAISAIASAINGLGQAAANNEAAIKAVLSFGAVIAGAKLATVAVGGVTTAFAAARIAVLGFSAALAASPIGAALVAVTALGAAAYASGLSFGETSDAVERTGKSAEKAVQELSKLKEQLKNAEDGASAAAIKLQEAEAALESLERRGAKSGPNLMLREAYKHAQRLVDKLREAKRQQDLLVDGTRSMRVEGDPYNDGAQYESWKAAEKARTDSEKALMEIRMRSSGINKQYFADMKTLQEALSIGTLTNEQYVKSMEELATRTWDASTAGKDAGKQFRESKKGIGATESAYATLSKRVNEYISQLALEAKQGDKVTAAQKLQIQLDELLEKSKGKLAAAKVAGLNADIQSALSMEKEAAASKLAADQAEEAAKAYDSVLDATMGRTKSLADQVKAEEEAAAAIGLSKEAVAALEMAKLSDMAATIERKALLMDDIDLSGQQSAALRAEAQAYRDLASVKGQRAVKQANADTAKKAKEDWEKVSKTIGDTLADYIMGGGKDAAQYLKRLFSTLVLQPVVQTVVGGIMGTGAAGVAGIASGGGGGGIGGLLNTASNIKTLMGLSGSGAALGSLGVSNAVGMAGGDALGALISTNAANWGVTAGNSMLATVGTAMPYLAGAGIGMTLGGAISGGYSVIGSSGNTANIAGTAIGAIVGGPLGAAIGGAIGGAVNRVFGRKLKDSGIEGTFGGDQGFAGNTFEYYKGGLLRKSKTKRSPLDEDTRSQFAGLFTSTQSSIKTMGDTLGLITDAVDGATYSIKLSLKGLSEEESSKAIQAEFDRIAESMAGLVLVTNEYSIADENRIETLTRLSGSLTAFNGSLELLGLSAYDASLKSADAAYKIISALGGLENYGQAIQGYYQNFYSEGERMLKQRELQMQALGDLGLYIDPASGDAAKELFRRTVEEAMASGQAELAAKLLAMSGAFASTADYAQQILGDLEESAKAAAQKSAEAALAAAQTGVDSAWANVQAAVEREKQYWSDIVSASQSAINALSSTLGLLSSNARELYGTVDSTQQMLAAQGMVYIENALAAVAAGASAADYSGLQDAITAARGGISGGVYASDFERERDALVLAGQLSELGELTDSQLSVEQRTLAAAQEQIEQLDATLEYWQQQIDGTAQLIDTGLSIESAISALGAALAARDAAKSGGGGGGGAGGGGSTGGAYTDGVLKKIGDAWWNGDWITAQNYIRGQGISNQQLQDAFGLTHADLTNLFNTGITGQNPGTYVFKADTPEGVYQEAKAQGLTLSQVDQILGANPGDAEEWARLNGLPTFSGGGLHAGGLRMVGERGWEVEATGPARIWNQQQLGQALAGGNNADLIAQNQALQAKVERLEEQLVRVANATERLADQFDNATAGGNAMAVEVMT